MVKSWFVYLAIQMNRFIVREITTNHSIQNLMHIIHTCNRRREKEPYIILRVHKRLALATTAQLPFVRRRTDKLVRTLTMAMTVMEEVWSKAQRVAQASCDMVCQPAQAQDISRERVTITSTPLLTPNPTPIKLTQILITIGQIH